MRLCSRLKARLCRFAARDEGSPLVEFAIVFPILILLLAGVTEIGRMMYFYTTLAKGTRSASRYLSSSRDYTSTQAAARNNAIDSAKNLVVCGIAKPNGCSGRTPFVPGVTTSNVSVSLSNGSVRYVTVSITGYQYRPWVFGGTSISSSAFTKTMAPGTRMRYLR